MSHVSVTGGTGVQRLAQPSAELGDRTVDGALVVRTEVDVLQPWRPAERELDVGVGYAFVDLPEGQRPDEGRHAAMLSARSHVLRYALDDNEVLRLSIGGNLDVLLDETGINGMGGSLTLDFELAARAPYLEGASDGMASASAPGEVGIGWRVEGGYHLLDDGTRRWLITAGVIVRLPAFAAGGVGFGLPGGLGGGGGWLPGA